MNDVIRQMIQRYKCQTESDWINALREVMQEIALQGLARGKFFDKAAFYGGTALRIMYGLNRGSEDLDFSLLKPDENFAISDYAECLKDELKSMGFAATFSAKEKSFDSPIDSAFLKMNTKAQLISIGVPDALSNKIHSKKELKIKLEVDTHPPMVLKLKSKRCFARYRMLFAFMHCRIWRRASCTPYCAANGATAVKGVIGMIWFGMREIIRR